MFCPRKMCPSVRPAWIFSYACMSPVTYHNPNALLYPNKAAEQPRHTCERGQAPTVRSCDAAVSTPPPEHVIIHCWLYCRCARVFDFLHDLPGYIIPPPPPPPGRIALKTRATSHPPVRQISPPPGEGFVVENKKILRPGGKLRCSRYSQILGDGSGCATKSRDSRSMPTR